MTSITSKYSKLSLPARKEVNDFVEFLFLKEKRKQLKQKSDFKKKILEVTQWSDDDCRIFDENRKLFNQWPIQKW